MAENIRTRGERKYPTITFNGQDWDFNTIKSPSHLVVFDNFVGNLDTRFTNMHSRKLSIEQLQHTHN
jgi:hypothetical protein